MSSAVVIGSSVGGIRAAVALREQGFSGPVTVVGAENSLPYDKPPLSKQFLSGAWGGERLTLLGIQEAAKAEITLRLGVAATHLDVARRTVELADGSRLRYDVAVIATGASARRSPWSTESGVHVLRTLADSTGLRRDLAAGGPVVVVGGGFIGAEVAATAHGGGHQVTVIDPLTAPVSRVLGPEVGELFAQVHARHQVMTHFGVGVEDIAGRRGDLKVTLTDGRLLRAATVVVGIGAVPNTEWLASSGLLIDDGVVSDRYCRALGRDDVYALGDVARWHHPRYDELVRVEHWTNAVEQASCVAYNITHPGEPRPYGPVEYVWSDQYDWKIQIAGQPHRGHGHEIVGAVDAVEPRFAVLFRLGADIIAAAAVNWPRALVTCRRIISGGGRFADARAELLRLAPPNHPL